MFMSKKNVSNDSSAPESIIDKLERTLEQRKWLRFIGVTDGDEQLNVALLERALDSLLPPANKGKNEPYAEMLKELAYFGIKTPRQLRELIQKHRYQILVEDGRKARLEKRPNDAFYFHNGWVRCALSEEFGDAFNSETINKIARGESIE